MESYRSGHNEPDSKSGSPKGLEGSNPSLSVQTHKVYCFVGFNRRRINRMNNIIKPFLEQHKSEYELEGNDAQIFEHLFNYLTVRNYTSRHFDPSDIGLGKGEVGIDGVAIIVKDTLVTTLPQIEDFFANSNDISVSFIFIQSKTSESFDSSEMTQFFESVYDFINNGKIVMNPKATEYRKICKYVLDHPIKLSKNPDCHLFYSFTGKKTKDSVRDALVDQQIERLKKTSYFEDITFSLYDSDRIISAYRSIKNSIKKTVEMTDCAVIPKVNNINEAYIGTVKCTDFINLITNEDGAIISNLFEDNVRYFQGHNTVNNEIKSTIIDSEKQQEFSILNNGVTIVAKEMRRTGNSFILSSYQVVNGCQTSFVLYENRKELSPNSYIILKIISTDDKNITDSIVKATNRQTPVLNEAFETLRDFHKKLELTYESYDIRNRLYYERRSKQYDSVDINKNRIISFPFQTSAYIAVFLREPHSTHRYYGELLKSYSKRLYNEDDILEQYCIASMYVYNVENFFKHNTTYSKYKKYKFHIALMLKCVAAIDPNPKPNSREMKKYCDELYKRISDINWVNKQIPILCDIISKIIEEGKIDAKDGNDITRMKEFTKLIIDKLMVEKSFQSIPESSSKLRKGSVVKCKVSNWNSYFAYLELVDYKEKGSAHISKIGEKYISDISDVLEKNQIVEAIILDDNPHPTFGYSLSISVF